MLTSEAASERIDDIMSDAFDRAAQVLDEQVRAILVRYPERYSRFVLAVGWGPSWFSPDGKLVDDLDKQPAPARRVMKFVNQFHDDYGGDNREVVASSEPAALSAPGTGTGVERAKALEEAAKAAECNDEVHGPEWDLSPRALRQKIAAAIRALASPGPAAERG